MGQVCAGVLPLGDAELQWLSLVFAAVPCAIIYNITPHQPPAGRVRPAGTLLSGVMLRCVVLYSTILTHMPPDPAPPGPAAVIWLASASCQYSIQYSIVKGRRTGHPVRLGPLCNPSRRDQRFMTGNSQGRT